MQIYNHHTNNKFEDFFNYINIGVVICNAQGKFINVNNTFCEITGYTKKELYNKRFHDITHEDDLDMDLENLNNALQAETDQYSIEKRYIKKDGSIIWVELFVSIIRDDNNEPFQYIGSIKDITAQKVANMELSSAKKEWEHIFQAISHPTIILDKNYRILDANEKVVSISNEKKEKLIGMPCYKVFHSKHHTCNIAGCPMQKSLESLTTHTIEMEMSAFDGSYLVSCTPVFDENNNFKYAIHIATDVTELKNAEKELKNEKQKFHKIFMASPDAIILSTLEDGIYLDVNQAFIDLTCFKREEVIGKSSIELNIWDSAKDRDIFIEKLHKDGRVKEFEAKYRAKNGKTGYVSMSTEKITIGGLSCIITQSREITARKKAELALKLSEEKFAKLFHASPDAITLANLTDRIIVDINQSASRLTEFDRDEIIGQSITSLKFWNSEADIKKYNSILLKDKRVSNFEAEFKTKSSENKIGLVSSEIIQINGDKYVIGIIRDVTIQKQAENKLRIAHERLQKSIQNLKEINTELSKAKTKAEENDKLKTAFLQNMSHEIRTPLNAIMGFSDILLDNLDDKTLLEKYLGIINSRGADLLQIINDILDIARIEANETPIHAEKITLNDLFNDLYLNFSELRERINKSEVEFNILFDCKHQIDVIELDVGKLKQIFFNLISNAFKFTDKGIIELWCDKSNPDFITFFISDTGIGIPKNKLNSIFNRFEQADIKTSQLYGGTGLGLSIVKGLLKLIGGEIWVESEVGKGTTFKFTFPVKHISTSQEYNSHKQNKFQIHDSNTVLNILIVEDDEINALYFKEVLKSANLNLYFANTGKDAIDLVMNNDIDIIFMDLGLPDISGLEVTRTIKKSHAHIYIVAQTAYASDVHRNEALSAGCDEYISKPLIKESVFQIIEDYLKSNTKYS